MPERTCIICGKTFEPRYNTKNRHLCCSAECRKKYASQKQKEYSNRYREKNPEKIKARAQMLKNKRQAENRPYTAFEKTESEKTITKINSEALAAGMSYGKYMQKGRY